MPYFRLGNRAFFNSQILLDIKIFFRVKVNTAVLIKAYFGAGVFAPIIMKGRIQMKKSRKSAIFILFIYIFSLTLRGYSFAEEIYEETSLSVKEDINVSSRFIELLFGKSKEKEKELKLIPGGEVFGIRINEPYVVVADCKDGSEFQRKDTILSVNGIEVSEPMQVCAEIEKSGGKALTFEILRSGEKKTVTATPILENGVYKLGITLKDTSAGIGTVTFIDPETLVFGGLGHGVSGNEGSSLAEIEEGEALGVILGGIKRGESGKPGELSGILGKKHYGEISKNNECGVFGKLDSYDASSKNAIPVAAKSEIKIGNAEIISTVKSGKTGNYKVEITEINQNETGSKCFKIRVTDSMLIALTGGIVRGMSGSPIIQDGKLIGAVTHVMVSDPTEGYGIFIENMLNAAA